MFQCRPRIEVYKPSILPRNPSNVDTPKTKAEVNDTQIKGNSANPPMWLPASARKSEGIPNILFGYGEMFIRGGLYSFEDEEGQLKLEIMNGMGRKDGEFPCA